MERRKKPFLKEDPAVVLTVSPFDQSCRVRRDSDNKTFLLNRSKLVRDPAFTDDDVISGGAVSSTPRGAIASPRSALQGGPSQDVSPVPRARKHLHFMGLQQIPDPCDLGSSQASMGDQDPGTGPQGAGDVDPVAPQDIDCLGSMVERDRPDPAVRRTEMLRPRRRVSRPAWRAALSPVMASQKAMIFDKLKEKNTEI